MEQERAELGQAAINAFEDGMSITDVATQYHAQISEQGKGGAGGDGELNPEVLTDLVTDVLYAKLEGEPLTEEEADTELAQALDSEPMLQALFTLPGIDAQQLKTTATIHYISEVYQ